MFQFRPAWKVIFIHLNNNSFTYIVRFISDSQLLLYQRRKQPSCSTNLSCQWFSIAWLAPVAGLVAEGQRSLRASVEIAGAGFVRCREGWRCPTGPGDPDLHRCPGLDPERLVMIRWWQAFHDFPCQPWHRKRKKGRRVEMWNGVRNKSTALEATHRDGSTLNCDWPATSTDLVHA